MSERHSTKVKFEAVAQNIQERINEGIYVSSQKLPSEYDLAKEFEVSRLTIRKAIDELVQKNILFKLSHVSLCIPTSTSILFSLNFFIPCPETKGLESYDPIKHLFIPDFITLSVQGGVFP